MARGNPQAYTEQRILQRLQAMIGPATRKAVQSALADPRMTDHRTPQENSVARSKVQNKAIGGGQIDDESVDTGHMRDEAVSGGKIKGGAVTGGKVDGSLKDGNQNSPSMRSIEGDGNATSAAASNHDHSKSFKGLPRERRRHLIALAQAIEGHASREKGTTSNRGEIEEIRELALACFEMLSDDIEETRVERETRIDGEEKELGHSPKEHHMKMTHDRVYHARHKLLNDPHYRKYGVGRASVREMAREMEELVELDDGSFALHEEELIKVYESGKALIGAEVHHEDLYPPEEELLYPKDGIVVDDSRRYHVLKEDYRSPV